MGKPYASELAQVPSTLAWATAFDIAPLRRVVRNAGSLPLLAVGSGGSLTAAHLLAGVHRRCTGRLASVSTPLEIIADDLEPQVSVWLISAGGRNVDILSAFSAVVKREPRQLCVMCGGSDSPLASEARQHAYVDLLEFTFPAGKDGFLATNSLLALSVLVARAYAEEYGGQHLSKSGLESLVRDGIPQTPKLASWRAVTAALWARDTTVVLHGPDTRAGALDLESKFTEAALGNVQVADYRNFAHGRHHWLAKRGGGSGVLAFTTLRDRKLADKTLALIPPEVPVARIDLDGDFLAASLASLVVAFYVAGWAGSARDIDPGRPGVPEFGRRLYNLGPPRPERRKPDMKLAPSDVVAIERKAGLPIDRLVDRGDLASWRNALVDFKGSLSQGLFSAIVFDYDGTLVETRDRFNPPVPEIGRELLRFLDAGLLVGIATGRGASVRRDLQASLPRSLWSRVIVGYYNGADVAALDDEERPDGTPASVEMLAPLAEALRAQPELAEIAKQSDRRHQITLEPRRAVPENRLWDIANQVVQIHEVTGVCVVRSSHSIDILAPGVSKRHVLTRVAELCQSGGDARILKIGDRGRWPGNDFTLLREPHSLSVDEVSVDPATCWNLAPPGQRGAQATLVYCRALRTGRQRGGARLAM